MVNEPAGFVFYHMWDGTNAEKYIRSVGVCSLNVYIYIYMIYSRGSMYVIVAFILVDLYGK